MTEDASAPEPALEAKDFNFYYNGGALRALAGVNLSVPCRRVTAMIGPSGCGKSTFLRAVNRMHEGTPGAFATGRLLLNGEDVNTTTDLIGLRKRVGLIFQRANPFPISIFDNVSYGLRLEAQQSDRRMSRGEIAERVEAALRAAYLWDEVKHKLGASGLALSGGQQQRLCIARAVAVEPEMLLMDEPCAALDPIATLAIEDLMLELAERLTILIVTHNMQQAARVSHYTAFFNVDGAERSGHLVEFGPTQTIFTNPRDRRTEDYISGRFG